MPAKDEDGGGKKKRINLNGAKGSGVTIASDMDVATAFGIIQALMEKEEIIRVRHNIEADRYDAAFSMLRVGDMLFEGGLRPHQTNSVAVDVDVDKTENLEWGCYLVPSVPGMHLQMDYNFVNGGIVFTILAKVKRKDAHLVKNLANGIRQDLKTNSIFHQKTVQMEFRDEDGDRLDFPRVSFFKPSGADPVMHPETAADIKWDIFTPLEYPEKAISGGNSARRGVMLSGEYGLGKTMQASMIARFAVKHGWTFFYLKDARDIVNALRYVHRNLPAVLFVEDVDRAVGIMKDDDGHPLEERDDRTQGIMNDIDSIGSKDDQVMLIMSTNHLADVHPAMLRPGRTDAVIEVLRPDAGAAMALVKLYAPNLCPDIDELEVGELLANRTPAEIREIVSKANLVAIAEGDDPVIITAESLRSGAARFDRQRSAFTNANLTPPGQMMNGVDKSAGDGAHASH